jgi:exoribonuclease R
MAESEVVCSTIRPTYRLSYDSVAELLLMHVEEEAELYLLAEVANLRREWRTAQVITLLDKLEGHLNWSRLNAGCTNAS